MVPVHSNLNDRERVSLKNNNKKNFAKFDERHKFTDQEAQCTPSRINKNALPPPKKKTPHIIMKLLKSKKRRKFQQK